jgi:hypothetical protein
MVYSNGPGNCLLSNAPGLSELVISSANSYQGVGGTGAVPFHGVGGTGAVPFFQGVGGTGAVPFFQGVGGTGAVPLAINTEASPWVVTTVLRPIAPVKTSNARTIADEIRDIVPPGGILPRAHSIRY